MSLRKHILDAWNNYEGKIRTKEDRSVRDIMWMIENWDDFATEKLIDFFNADIGRRGFTEFFSDVPSIVSQLSHAFDGDSLRLPQGSSFRVKYYNRKKEKLLCPLGQLILSKRDQGFFDDFVGGDLEEWVEEFKASAETVLGKKLAWEVTIKER